MPQFPYQFFQNFAVRTPYYSQKDFHKKISKEKLPESDFREICTDAIFQEAIYLASPELYQEMSQWLLSEKEFAFKIEQKLHHTLLKYYIRMSTRATPFGLFSGIGLGSFDKPDAKTSASKKLRDTKLDMHFLVSLGRKLENTKEIRNHLLYFPNNSIYTIGKRIRYVEYSYTNGKRDYIISSAPSSEELLEVLYFSKNGKTIQQIAQSLISEEISDSEAEEFIEELIENQVLVSELEPVVSGENYFDHIISILDKIEASSETKILKEIKEKLFQLDQAIGNPVLKYQEIEGLIQLLDTEYEQKYLFQTDLYFQNKFYLSPYIKKEIKQGIVFLNKINTVKKNTPIEQFKKAFAERYESEEIPLSLVLDTEIGIGYRQNTQARGVHPYLDELKIPKSPNKEEFEFSLTPFQEVLNQKLQKASLENQLIIEFSDEDVKDFEEKWEDLPKTFSVMAQLISENKTEKLILGGIGGSSAANLLGRFCSEKSKVQDLTKKITEKEERSQTDDNAILAEIIHLPDSRIGNIIRRPALRNYEIPYLAQSVAPAEMQISIKDLYLSVQSDRLILRSKKLNKEVIPFLTNAHNYQNSSSLPVYHFLCDLSSQNKRRNLHFNWGALSRIYRFLPRVEYKNIILSKAKWSITEQEIQSLQIFDNKEDKLVPEMQKWRIRRNIPQLIEWVESDNILPVNLENSDMIKIFLEIILKHKSITVEEYLYHSRENLKKEFVFPMFKV
ncbi:MULTISPECIES: lantibiotic dehydratase family protein [Chryseobacterium]|uniref:Lantibiotic dehydratase, C terminus n=1 Tax=Chryseobacterium taihuense TaxID=1141221 RepID=A0A4U8WDS9_9FLAO|nr:MULTISPECIES: lantibiotic dehydratase family protein [Chryseobacterium]QQV02412.1 lantibiotic dehydratase family protein [Chryseobacterium sp. FDAARGOS 1104]VFB04333.1 Lantibiotic dehydratase, C terminus [Chryseobacterium taihuense]